MSIHKNIKLLTWFNFFTEFRLYTPVAIIYFAKVSGSFTLGMSVFSLITLSSAAFEVPTGIFSDLIGRKKTIICGALASFFSLIFYAIGGSYWLLALGAVFQGLGLSFYSGNNNALLYDTLQQDDQQEEYHHFLGRVSSMFQLALGFSAIAGGLIASWSFSWVMWLSVIPQFICLVLAFGFVDLSCRTEKSTNIFAHTKEAFKNFARNRKLRLLSFGSVLDYALGESAFYLRPAFINTLWPVWALGFAKMLSNLTAALGFYFSGRVIKKFKELRSLIIGSIYSRVVNLLSLIFPSFFSPVLMSSTSFFFGITSTAKGSLFQKEFTQEQRATMDSLNSLLKSIGFTIVSFLLGFFADRLGPTKGLIIIHLVSFTTILIYWRLKKLHQ